MSYYADGASFTLLFNIRFIISYADVIHMPCRYFPYAYVTPALIIDEPPPPRHMLTRQYFVAAGAFDTILRYDARAVRFFFFDVVYATPLRCRHCR